MALNNLVNTTTGVKEYNVDMAAAIIAALPTLFVYTWWRANTFVRRPDGRRGQGLKARAQTARRCRPGARGCTGARPASRRINQYRFWSETNGSTFNS